MKQDCAIKKKAPYLKVSLKSGGPCWVRTNGPMIKSHLLYQLS